MLADSFSTSDDDKIKNRMKQTKHDPADVMLYYFKGSDNGCLSRACL